MARELDNWLDSYLKYTDNTESPVSYHTWCGLSVIAGALQRRVYLQWGLAETIYPNLYVVLIGPSGRTRKGTAIGIAKSMLKATAGVTVVPESSSGRQAMILAMKRASKNFEDPIDGKIKFHCSVTAFSEELSVFLGQGDIAYLSNLTDWYDSKDDWEYETVGRGKDSLQGLCLNLCGGTAPDWIQSMIPQEALGGGFTSRVIFVVEEKKRKIVPEYVVDDATRELGEKLERDLERIANLSGEMTFDEEGKQAYVNWYIDQDTKLSAGQAAIPDTRFSGYCERRATHLRKLMLVCSASRGDDLKLTKADFLKAKGLMEAVEVNMGRTFGGLGKARTSAETDTVMDFIRSIGTTTRKALLQKFYRDIDPMTLSTVETTLEQAGKIKIKLLVQERDKMYTWIGD
jgi:hypothetical protein